jgi:oxygen-independent coproporphyrinogen-3 oxidase
VEDYEQTIHEQRLALLKGHVQTESDRLLKRCILELSCHGFLPASLLTEVLDVEMLDELKVMQTEGIVELSEDGLTITPTGRAFVRNVCCVFDLRLRTEARPTVPVFSKSI